jgi:hypothetical protein
MCRQIHVLKAWPQIKLRPFGAIAHLRDGAAFGNVEVPTSDHRRRLGRLACRPARPAQATFATGTALASPASRSALRFVPCRLPRIEALSDLRRPVGQPPRAALAGAQAPRRILSVSEFPRHAAPAGEICIPNTSMNGPRSDVNTHSSLVRPR